MGRAIALLGIVQIALGLTLYGSPKVLFGLYALVVFLWLLLYFILAYIYHPATYDDETDYGSSYVSGPSRRGDPTRTDMSQEDASRTRQQGHGLRNTAIIGAGLAGLAALRRKSSNRREEIRIRREDEHGRAQSHRSGSRRGSRHTSGSYTEEEKYSERPDVERHTWRNRILGAGAGLAAYEGAKRFFNRRSGKDEESEIGSSTLR